MTGIPTTTRTAAEAGYDGHAPFPRPAAPARAGIVPVTPTAAIVIAPFLALGAGIWLAWGSGITLTDLLLAAVFYIDWVAVHRRHHAFTDQPGDPHSPYRYGTGLGGQLRGLAHAHLGWLFSAEPTSAGRYAPDLLRNDPAMLRISRAFPALCAASLLLPFAAGWAIRCGLAAP